MTSQLRRETGRIGSEDRSSPAAGAGLVSGGPDYTVDDLVRSHDLIVTGTISQLLSTDWSPSDYEMEHEYGVPTEEWATWDERGLFSQFLVDVDTVMLDLDAQVGLGKPVILFTPAGPPYPLSGAPGDGRVRVGDRYLLILSRLEDDDWPANLYVLWNSAGDAISVDGATPVDSMSRPVESAEGMSTADFLTALEEAIERVYGSG